MVMEQIQAARQRVRNTGHAFTLVEILIVVAIIGILAAVVIPEFQGHAQEAKQSAAKDNLRILRNAIELYTAQHNDVPPGYNNGDITTPPDRLIFVKQLCYASNESGQIAQPGTPGYNLGPYLPEPVSSPFNGKVDIQIIGNEEDFPSEATGTCAWIYKAITKTIKLDWPGTDSQGTRYIDY